MRTDYVDLYQLHRPNRGSYMFRKNWHYDPTGQDRAATLAHMQEVLDCRTPAASKTPVGLSNEAHGTAQWLGSLGMARCRAWLRSE